MKISVLLSIAILMSACKNDLQPQIEKDKTEANTTTEFDPSTIDTTSNYDVEYELIDPKDPFKSSDNYIIDSPEIFRERFNVFMQNSKWNLHLNKGHVTDKGSYSICTMLLTDSISIVAKLDKKYGRVLKVVLFGKDRYDTQSGLLLIRAMKGIIATVPTSFSITPDEIEVILFRLGALSDETISPHGLWIVDYIKYEAWAKDSNVIFSISTT